MGNKLSSLNCSAGPSSSKGDFTPYVKELVIEHNVGKTEHRGLSAIAPDVLPLDAAQFAKEKRFSKCSSVPSSPSTVSNNNENSRTETKPTTMFVFNPNSSEAKPAHLAAQVSVSSFNSEVDGYRKDNIYCNIPNKKFAVPLPPVPSAASVQRTDSKRSADLIPEEELTPPTGRRDPPPPLPGDTDECCSPKLPPRPKHLLLPKSPLSPGSSIESMIRSPPPRKTVDFATIPITTKTEEGLLSSGYTPLKEQIENVSECPNVVKKRPRKPPRNYSYKASTLPKRISHTTEEVMELWDEVRKALSLERMQSFPKQQPDIAEEDNDDVDEIYQNLYAARMRSWQIMCLAQDVLVDKMKPGSVWQFFLSQCLLSKADYASLDLDTLSDKESNQLIIDRILEQGDGHFDKLREFLRNQKDQKHVSDLLESLNQIFIIGAKANKWTFSLTTKHCSVGYGSTQLTSKPPDLIGDTEEGVRPIIILEVYDENFGNNSCASLAEVLNKYGVVSQLNLGKNRITSKGLAKLLENIETNKTLEKLNLRLNPIENDGLGIIECALGNNQSVRELILCHTNLQAGCGKSIANLLINNNSIQTLDLSYNEICDGDCRDIQRGLSKNSSLRSLILRGNQFSAKGCEYLCAGLLNNYTVQVLDLSHNNIGDEGAQSIALLLLQNDTMQKLLLENCTLYRVGCTALAGSLKSNTSISCLHLSNNAIGDFGASDLADMLQSNAVLNTLYINLCGLTRVGLLQLLEVIANSNDGLRVLGACYNDLLLNDEDLIQNGISAQKIRQLLNLALENHTDRKILTWGRAFA